MSDPSTCYFPTRRRRPRPPPFTLVKRNLPTTATSALVHDAPGPSLPSSLAVSSRKRNWTPGLSAPSLSHAAANAHAAGEVSGPSQPAPPFTSGVYRSANSGPGYWDAHTHLAHAHAHAAAAPVPHRPIGIANPYATSSSSSAAFEANSAAHASPWAVDAPHASPSSHPAAEPSRMSHHPQQHPLSLVGGPSWSSGPSGATNYGPPPQSFAGPSVPSESSAPAGSTGVSLHTASAASASGVRSDSAAWHRLNWQRQREDDARRQQLQQQRRTSLSEDSLPNEHVDGPAPKKRKGVAGAIVEGALNTALYAGAAAITAYSLWASWGRKPDDDDDEPDGGRALAAGARANGEASGSWQAQEKCVPPGGLEEPPPPPYGEPPLSPSASTTSLGSSSRPAANLASRVYVSRGRRRAAVPSFRAARVEQARRARIAASRRLQAGLGTAEREGLGNEAGSLLEAGQHEEAADARVDEGARGESDDEDEYMRMSKRMEDLIRQGQAALSAKADLDSHEVDMDEGVAPAKPSSPAKTALFGGEASSRRAATSSSSAASGPSRTRFGRGSALDGPGAGLDPRFSTPPRQPIRDSPLHAAAAPASPEPTKPAPGGSRNAAAAATLRGALGHFRSGSQVDFDFTGTRAAAAAASAQTNAQGGETAVEPSVARPSSSSLSYTATNPFARHDALSRGYAALSPRSGGLDATTSSSGTAARPFVFGAAADGKEGGGVGQSGGRGGAPGHAAGPFAPTTGRLAQRSSPYHSHHHHHAAAAAAAGAASGSVASSRRRI